ALHQSGVVRHEGRSDDLSHVEILEVRNQRWLKLARSGFFGTTTSLMSQKNSKLQSPPSRPTPLRLMPPKGAARSRMPTLLTQMKPVRTRSATAAACAGSP